MISPIILATALRAWLFSTRDSFSRSSLGINVRCTSALNCSKFSCSTLCHPTCHCENGSLDNGSLDLHPNKLNRFFLSATAGRPHAVLAICRSTDVMDD